MHRRPGVSFGLATAAAIAVGLLILRTAFASNYSLAAEFLANRLTYFYVFAATAVVFIVLGYVLGRQADELRRLSTTDSLTGLFNRHGFRVRLREEWRRSRRYHAPLALLLIDVDGLKRVNDDRGHQAGDRVLRGAGAAIKETLRETDFGARWGGDEFAIIAANTARPAAQRLGHRLLQHMKQHAHAGAPAPTLSIGVAVFDPAEESAPAIDELMRAADQALYEAKSSGRNRLRVAWLTTRRRPPQARHSFPTVENSRGVSAAAPVMSADKLRRSTSARISTLVASRLSKAEVSMILALRPALLGFIVGTRAALAFGVALLVADRIPQPRRRVIGMTLIAIGAATTIPALKTVWGRRVPVGELNSAS